MAFLARAAAAYEATLTEQMRERVPLDWAASQSNLAGVFRSLGELQDDTAYLHKAVTANEAALTVRYRESVPLGWAMTQYNLGGVLWSLGSRERDVVPSARRRRPLRLRSPKSPARIRLVTGPWLRAISAMP